MRKHRGAVLLILTAYVFCFCSGCRNFDENQMDREEQESVAEMQNAALTETDTEEKSAPVMEKKVEEGDVPADKADVEEHTEPEIADVIQSILHQATKEMTGSYRIDDSFLMWLAKQYGRESVYELQEVTERNPGQIESWYEITGKSIHVLWVEYCRDTGIQEYYLEKVYEKECADEDQVIMDFTGDINLAEGWTTTKFLDRQSGGIRDCFSSSLWEEMQNVDILMINNEFAFSRRGTPLAGKAYTFRSDPQRVSTIAEIGTDVLSLANNHVYDYGEEALIDTLETVEGAGIPYVGAGRNLEEAMKPVYFIANGRKIAIVSATQIERTLNYTKEATEDTAGVLKTLNPDKFVSVIQKADSLSDYVIVFVHWGTENTNYCESDQTALGQAFIDAGADVIIGGHTHCLQGFSYYNGKPVIYSLGNYWFNNRTIDTGLSQVIIHTDRNEIDFRFLPCIQRGCVTSLAGEEEKQRILDFMQRISDSNVCVGEDGMVTEVP